MRRTTPTEALGCLFGAVVIALFLIGWVLPVVIAVIGACYD